jgi:hypothetical protein
MMAILQDRIQIGKAVNATVISVGSAPQGMRNSIRESPGSSLSIQMEV